MATKRTKKDAVSPRINANVPVALIRDAYDSKAVENRKIAAALEMGRNVVENLSDEQIIKIAKREATLEGGSPGAITFVDYDERWVCSYCRTNNYGLVKRCHFCNKVRKVKDAT